MYQPLQQSYRHSETKAKENLHLCHQALKLTIPSGKNYVLLDLVQEFTEIEAWLLLTFFVCFHSQLNFIYSIVIY